MMMKKLTAWLLVLLAVATAAADRLPASPSIDDLGNLTVGKLALHWTRYAPDWRSETLQADDFKADAGFPRRSPAGSRFPANGTASVSRFRRLRPETTESPIPPVSRRLRRWIPRLSR